MNKILLFVFLFVFPVSFIHADYKSDMTAGNTAYKNGILEEALTFYEAALGEQPNDTLFTFVDKLRKKIGEKKQGEKAGPAGPDKTALIVLDIALSGIAAASYLDYSASSSAYENLYTAINNTTPENYSILVNEKAQVESKGTFMAIAAGVAGAAVLYTLADIFIFNGNNSGGVRADIKPLDEYAGLTACWRF